MNFNTRIRNIFRFVFFVINLESVLKRFKALSFLFNVRSVETFDIRLERLI